MAGSSDSSNKESNSKVAFVAPTDFRCHSMLHQTLTPPFLQFPFHHHHHHHTISAAAAAAAGFLHPPPPPTATPPRTSTQSMQGLRESRSMEVVEAAAIKKARRQEAAPPEPQQQQGFLLPDDVAWAAERGGLLGEEFSVDDLLDFEGLDTDKEAEEEGEDGTKGDAFLDEKEATTSPAGDSFPAEAPPPLSDISFPAHDAAEFEWMNSIMDDSVPEYPLCPGVAPYRPSSETTKAQFKTHRREPKQEPGWAEYMPAPPSPAATIVCKLSTEDLVPVKAKRSKRPRTAGNSWPNLGAGTFTDSSASSATTTTTSSPSSSCSSASSPSSTYFFVYDNHPTFLPSPAKKQHKPKKRGRKPKHYAAAFAVGEVAAAASGDRRCTHCGAQKTPQWRAGPAGPKTLCNACGVRYKSGRLVPEYRPAASPTFVSHVHSNSHRKVLEMRRKKEEQHVGAAAPAVATLAF